MNVLSGICQGGPKHGQTLATMAGRKVTHPDDPKGFYVHRPPAGPTPASWQWIANKEQSSK
jgi:hypothetical protein